ncbi:hypothetical protein HHK36_031459 (chloroplast) [Tetracentron sinense]|uniref:50S ribosomal protein L16, chloroplastic n=1 Tax=Tetracentron sinense TaxID=13715 RepID=A0A834Y934_TETSI|nr:hypothetical protein HHK36_031459 [Tetracentron sinense]
MPLGTAIHNIEITLGKGGQLARAAGAVAKLIAKEGKSATLKLPSGEVRLISKNCSATVGQVGNVGVNQKSLGRAGSKCWLAANASHNMGFNEADSVISKAEVNEGTSVKKYALQALEPTWITSRQIEAGRRAMTRYARRGGKIWVRIFPDKPVTVRPTETRMGSGKGSPEYWVSVVKPGRILYEMGGVSEIVAREAIEIAASKMPIRTQFIIAG